MKIVNALQAGWYAAKSVFTAATIHAVAWLQGFQTNWGQITYSALSRRTYRNPTAARALRLVSQLMSSLPFVVKNEKGDIIEQHDMLRLIDRPNPRTSRGLLFDQIVAHLYCAGEIFMLRNAPDTGANAGMPTAKGGSLTLLNPDRFHEFIREDGTDAIKGYRFSDRKGRSRVYTTDEVLHIRIYNPMDEDRGMPLILGASRALEQQEAADDWNKSLASGGGRIAGVLSPKLPEGKQLTPEQQAVAQESADRIFGGARRQSKDVVLSGAMDYTAASMTMKDADFLKAGQQNMRHISAVVGISPTLLGDEKGGSLTDAGIDSEVRAAYMLTVLPLIDFVLQEVNNWLAPLYGVTLAYDRDKIDALSEDQNKAYERLHKAAGGAFITVNEAREERGWTKLGAEHDTIRTASVSDPREREPAPLRSISTGDRMGGVRAAVKARIMGTAA